MVPSMGGFSFYSLNAYLLDDIMLNFNLARRKRTTVELLFCSKKWVAGVQGVYDN